MQRKLPPTANTPAPGSTEAPGNAPANAPANAIVPVNASLLHQKAMDHIAVTFGLTERERETASLIAQGYTAKRVAEELIVTPSTIQGYNKSIYRKMGIHRKDELIEIVNQVKQLL